ncbi:MAG: serine protease [Vicinamibacteria bacterium]|nr:serine protease [Vicinamibacteria bacterium]
MNTIEREPCFFCAEPVALDARVCPHCKQDTLVDVVLERAVADSRRRYRVARALASLGAAMPPFMTIQQALATPGSTVARRVTRGLARQIAGVLTPEGVSTFVQHSNDLSVTKRPWKALAIGAGALLIAGVAWLGVRLLHSDRPEKPALVPLSSLQPSDIEYSSDLSTRELAERALPSTVSLRCAESVASGFFVAKDLVLTNAHAVCPDGVIRIILSDGRELSGLSTQTDRTLDLALVKVAGGDALPLPLGDAGVAAVGDKVVFIGSPVGLEFTVHEGSISSLSRSLNGLAYIQMDAKVNPGNSGGPLLDSHGRVIGIVSLKHMAAEGIGLALPINYSYTGTRPILAAPQDAPASTRFEEMMAHARRESREEAFEEPETPPQLPILVAASVDQYDRLLAHIVLPASQTPGFREISIKIWAGAEMICALKGDVSDWAPFDENAPPVAVDRNILHFIATQHARSQLFLGESPLRWDLCPRERMHGTIVLELDGADPQASRLVVRVQRYR